MEQKFEQQCTNCSASFMRSRPGVCTVCAAYMTRHGRMRPAAEFHKPCMVCQSPMLNPGKMLVCKVCREVGYSAQLARRLVDKGERTAEALRDEAIAKAVAKGLRPAKPPKEPEPFVMPIVAPATKRAAAEEDLALKPGATVVVSTRPAAKRVKHALSVPQDAPAADAANATPTRVSRKVQPVGNVRALQSIRAHILADIPPSARQGTPFTGTLGETRTKQGPLAVRIDPGGSTVRYPPCLLKDDETCTARNVALANMGAPVSDVAWFPVLDPDDTHEPAALAVATSTHSHSSAGACQKFGTIKILQVGVASTSCAVAVTAVFRTPRALGCVLALSASPYSASPQRLGVLAAGHASGAVAIYAVPRFSKPASGALIMRAHTVLGPVSGCEFAMATQVEWYQAASNASARPWLAAVDSAGRVRVWNAETRDLVATPVASGGTPVQSIAWSPSAPDLLALASQLGVVTLWNAGDPLAASADLPLSGSAVELASARIAWGKELPTLLAIGQPPAVVRRSLTGNKHATQLRVGSSGDARQRVVPTPTCLCASRSTTAFVGTACGAVLTCDLVDRASRDGDLFTCVQLVNDESSDASDDDDALVLRLRTERLTHPVEGQLGAAGGNLVGAVRAVAVGDADLMAYGTGQGVVAVVPVALVESAKKDLE